MNRLRWLAAFIAILFVGVLGAMASPRGAAAQPAPVAGASAAHHFDFDEEELDESEEEDGEDEGEEADECEFDDEAREEACEEALEELEMEEIEAEECRLESAEATVAAVPGRNEVRLTVRYKTFEPSTVSIDLGLRGGRGALDLGTDTARFGRSGTLHSSQTLSGPQMARAMAAKEFTVAVYALNTPDYCRDSFERHLTARKGAGAGVQWSDPTAVRRSKDARSARASRVKSA